MTIERFPPMDAASKDNPPYAKAVRANGFVFVSGQVGVNAEGRLVQGGIAAETRQTIENIHTVLQSVGLDLNHVVKATAWLVNASDYDAFNAIYREYFGGALPARACVCSELMGPFRVEIEVVAAIEA
jgi:2-iminobutanoate/2-iminopropanoate deaminase